MTISVEGRTRVAINGAGEKAGPPGSDGRTILSGPGAPGSATGKDGDFWLDSQKSRLYGPKDRGVWPRNYTTLKGAQGDRGASILHSNGPPFPAWGRVNDFYLDTDALVLYGAKTKAGWPNDGVPLVAFISGSGAPSDSLGTDGQVYYDTLNKAIYGPKDGGAWPAGESLVVVLTGTGVPPNVLGLNGQLYIDTESGIIYGPKSGGIWVAHPVRTQITGTGAPSSGTGVDGQVYLDTATGNLYGPKASGAWPAPTPLVAILTGLGAPSSGTGVNGQYYLDTAAAALYGPKASGAWPSTPAALLKVTLTGSGAPLNSLGIDGQIYFDITNKVLYGPKTAGAWGAGFVMKGDQGLQGAPGSPGPGSGDVVGPGSGATVGLPAVFGNTAGTVLQALTAAQILANIGALPKAGGALTGALTWAGALSVAAAATTDIGALDTNRVIITGSGGPITSLGTGADGLYRRVRFTGAPTLTYHATNLVLPGSADIVVAAGDTAEFVGQGSGAWRCFNYQRASGRALADPSLSELGGTSLAMAYSVAAALAS